MVLDRTKFDVMVSVKYLMESNHDNNTINVMEQKCLFDCSSNIDKTAFIGPNRLPNALGAKLMTDMLIDALVSNIHYCHQDNFRDSAEHLRYIISKLEEGFVEIRTFKRGDY
jgi:hypothetical protein